MSAEKMRATEPINLVQPAKLGSTTDQAWLERVCQKLVLHQFSQMKNGQIEITLPNKQTVLIGDESNEQAAKLRISSSAFFKKCVLFGAIGFAESYMDGDWQTDDLTAVITWFIHNGDQSTVLESSPRKSKMLDIMNVYNRIIHRQRENSLGKAKHNIHAHYDLGNKFFELFLDSTMTYSSALFQNRTQSLESAQLNKYDRLCQQLHLSSTDQILEIGSGWGQLAVHAATQYGSKVTTITLSEEQHTYVSNLIEKLGLQDRVTVELKDFRLVEGQFDKIISIEMVEALGDKYINAFFSKCSQLLTADGMLAVQMICTPDCRYDQLKDGVDFIQKHIFPGGQLLSVGRAIEATKQTSNLSLYDLHDFAESYALTLHMWKERFNNRLDEVRAMGFDESFIRKWNYYFSYCEAAFSTREVSVVQAVFARPNNRMLSGKLAL